MPSSPVLNGHEINSWDTSFPELKTHAEMEGAVMNIFSIIILLIAGIGILNLLLMAVYERTREIGMLGALGLRAAPDFVPVPAGRHDDGRGGAGRRHRAGAADQSPVGAGWRRLQHFRRNDRIDGVDQRAHLPHPGHGKAAAQRGMTVIIISVLAACTPAHEAAQNEPAEALHFV